MLPLGNIVRPRKLTILGKFIIFHILCFNFDYMVSIYYTVIALQIYHSPATTLCTWAESRG